ncbi:MAG TPA: hypothetical protein VGJ86_00820 [Acidimicrobiales bacterium]|jgi:hypothetical protein
MTVALPLCVGLVTAAAACSDDDASKAQDRDANDSAGEVLESAGARGLAEALRVVLVSDNAFEQHPRSVDVLQENVDDLPGKPKVTGIEDDDGDGMDDDGNLQVYVDDEIACVFVSDTGRVDVTGGGCAGPDATA